MAKTGFQEKFQLIITKLWSLTVESKNSDYKDPTQSHSFISKVCQPLDHSKTKTSRSTDTGPRSAAIFKIFLLHIYSK